MRSAVSPTASSRSWWPRSKSKDPLRPNGSLASLPCEDEKYPSTVSSKAKDVLPSLKFNTLASAMGFKSKKLPALTIQDPPSPIANPLPYSTSRPGSGHSSTLASPVPLSGSPFYTNRPPAKSISTVRSSDYDYDAASEPHSEPRTPSDHPRDCLSYQQSVMTFSEFDPFASGGIVVQHLQQDQDSNRLSVYSDSSMLDPLHKRPELPPSRVSYASSSSNSQGAYSDVQALSPLSPRSSFGRSPLASRSAHDLSQANEPYDGHFSSGSHRARRMKSPSGSNSSNSTVTPHDYRTRLSEPPGGNGFHLPRKRSSPALARPRGLTVGAIEHRPSTTSSVTMLSPVQPLRVRRKNSDSSSPSSSNTPSPSPVTFSRSRTTSTSTAAESPASPTGSRRPLVLVRKASSPRLPPPLPAPPAIGLPPPPVPCSPYDASPLEFRASSSSSSLNFAPSVDFHNIDTGDAITQLMNESYDLAVFDRQDRDRHKGRSRSYRTHYVPDGDVAETGEGRLQSSLNRFPPVPSSIHGETSSSKAAKLLRKTSSQHNLSQQSGMSTSSSASGALEEMNGHGSGHASSPGTKTPRKQRSFHASRVPLPPLPGLRHGHSSRPSEVSFPQSSSPNVETRRSSITSPRKRLFSGSSARRSTSSSHGPTSLSGEEDKRSIFSFDSDIRPATSSGIESITMTFGSSGGSFPLKTRNARISPAALWDANKSSAEHGSKRVSQSEYVPQYIMSPAEQLKLAEKLADEHAAVSVHEPESETEQLERKPKLDLQPGDFGLTYSAITSAVRSRSNSVLSSQSTGTLAFGDTTRVSRGASILSSKSSIASNVPRPALPLASPPKASLVDPIRGPSRSTSMLARSVNKPPPISARPSTAQGSVTPPSSPSYAGVTPSPEISSASLPPPPRRRLSRTDLQDASKRASVVPLNPLSPPPIRPIRHRRQDSTDTAKTTASSRPPSSFDRQKILQRRSLMKKPSFLEIEDDIDVSVEDESEEEFALESPTMESSFLDMDRGKNSFDTVRSTDSAFFV